MELSVRPEDLVVAGGVLRAIHSNLADALDAFEAAATRLVPVLGSAAALAAGQTARDTSRGVAVLQDNIAVLAAGLTTAAAAYVDTDAAALGPARMR